MSRKSIPGSCSARRPGSLRWLALLLIAKFGWAETRYALISLPLWIILSPVALRELLVRADSLGKILSLGVLLLLVADSLSQDVLYHQYQHGQRPDSKAAYASVEQEKAEDDLVFATAPAYGHYYLSDEVRWMENADPADLERAGRRAWFVFSPDHRPIAPELGNWILKNCEPAQVFELSLTGKNLSIPIYLYDPARASPSAVSSG